VAGKQSSVPLIRIVRDLQVLGDTCTIACTKEDIRFSVSRNIETANILTRANAASDDERNQVISKVGEPVEINFALRYLAFFTMATSLSDRHYQYESRCSRRY
jgi:proliferating cell nuclear antigen